MAAPAFVRAGIANVVTSSLELGITGAAVGNFVVWQAMQDGTGAAPTLSAPGPTVGHFEDLTGTIDTLSLVGVFDIGAAVAKQHVWVGRVQSTTPRITVATASENLYTRGYEFSNVNTGTTLADVIENATAGTATNGTGAVAAVTDTGVTTLAADRLALNLVGVNDDNALAEFTGMTGGTWAEAVAEFASATGTDGAIQLQTAAMASAGTINGGTQTMAVADPWGVVGFALIGTTAAAGGFVDNEALMVLQAVNRSNVF